MYKLMLIVAMLVWVGGCGESESSSMHERQDKAMKDPFNYSPYPDKDNIGNGGTGEFHKDAFKRDVNSVFNP